MSYAAVFLDKDGTLIEDVPYNVNPDLIRFTPRADEGLRLLQATDYLLIVISNQSGVARGYFSEAALVPVMQRSHELLAEAGATLTDFYYCPHHRDGRVTKYAIACSCRKPEPGMLLQAAKDHDIDLARSWFIGDILNDVEAGRRAGCQTILLNTGHETEWILSPLRQPHYVASNLLEAASIIHAATVVSPVKP